MAYYTSGGYTKQYFINQAGVREVVLSTNTVSADTQTGGVNLNVVPKDGGNTFSVYFNTSYTGKDLQQSNLTDTLRARGLTTGSSLKKVWDIGGGLGGPIMRDRLWFYTAHRSWGNHD